jgi:hypothetical protein
LKRGAQRQKSKFIQCQFTIRGRRYHELVQAVFSRFVELSKATYHNYGGSLSFADGHSEIHKWRDPTTATAPRNSSTVNNPDYFWLKERTSGLR